MPYDWTTYDDAAAQTSGAAAVADGPLAELRLWPYQSLTSQGFVWFIAVTSALLTLPLLAVVGSGVLWGVLPFIVLAVWAIWTALRRNGRDRQIAECLTLSPDRAELIRHDKTGERRWQANPYWVSVHLHQTGGPVPNYLTLQGGGREVEIGSFLSEDERLALKGEIAAQIMRTRAR